MMKQVLPVTSRYSTILLAVFTMMIVLPAAFDKAINLKPGNPLLFYSPLKEQFIYRESLGGHNFNYQSEDGTHYDRLGFEKQLPFLYYKNLEQRNLFPVSVAGRRFHREKIKAGRQGLEIKSRHLNGHHPQIELYPLFNNDPNVAIMPFPEDVFRFTNSSMEFINAEYNRVDKELTEVFTSVLKEEGFVFPATVIGGKTTNLKPFDEGFFIRDGKGQVFHVKRVNNRPQVKNTLIDSSLDIQDIIVSENRRREFYGTIITRQGELYLISYDNYRLIPLPVEQYRPSEMDFKLLITPLFQNAVVSDRDFVRGTAMDKDYAPIRRFELKRKNTAHPLFTIVKHLLLPYQLEFHSPFRAQADPQLHFGGPWSLIGILCSAGVYLYFAQKKDKNFNKGEMALVLVSGFYGLLALSFISRE